MIIFLSEEQKKHLKCLHSLSLPEFCKLTVDFISNGPNLEIYSQVADKLHLDLIDIQNTVQAIAYLIIESCRYNLSETDFNTSLSIAGFLNEQFDILHKLYNHKREEISRALSQLIDRNPTFLDLSWRFEVQVSSKSKKEEVKPSVTFNLKLQTPKPIELPTATSEQSCHNFIPHSRNISLSIADARTASECKNVISHIFLQSDIPNLVNMTYKLEQALAESKSQHVRKVQRALQIKQVK